MESICFVGKETNMDNSRKAIYVNVTNLLHEIGIPAHIVGHDYIRHAIVSACENPALLKNITKHLYVKVAIYYDTSVYSVEKGIRNAIEVAWARGDISAIHSVFGNTVHFQRAKPSNKEFIAMIVDVVRTQMMD